MSFELFPPASTRGRRLRIVARNLGGLPKAIHEVPALHFWSTDLAGFDADDGAEVRTKWNMFLGLLVVVAVSGSFWGGVGWLIARFAR